MNLGRMTETDMKSPDIIASTLLLGKQVPTRAGKISGALVLFLLGFLTAGYSQETGVLKGTVEDSTGSAIAEARIALKHVETGKHFSAATDDDGYFQVGELPLGQYVVTVKAGGFETWETTMEVGAKHAPTILIRLKPAQLKQQVTVKAQAQAAPVPSALDNPDYFQLDQTSLQHLPIKEGDPLAIPSLFLEPAVTGAQGPQLIVDGVEATSLELPTSAIKEIYVNKSPYTAEFGRPGKGRIEVITRQGSRHHYRGSVTMLFRNSALDARNAFAPTRPPMQRPIGEVQLSGPLSKRIAFFVAGRYVHSNQSSVIAAVTPAGSLAENYPARGEDVHGFGRLDFKLTRRNQATLSYKYKDKSRRNQNVGGFDLPSRATDTLDRENEVRFFDTTIVSESFVNDARLTYKQQTVSTASLFNTPAIIVLDSFHGGGAQQSQAQEEKVGVAQDIATAIKGKHTMRFGFAARPRLFHTFNATNFGGTFTFSSLATFAASQPFLFTENQGNPSVSYYPVEYSSFFQDEVRLRPSLSLSLGVRHEFQSDLAYYRNVAPRVSLAFAPGKGKTVLRAGAGFFYDRLPGAMEQQSLLYGGTHILQVVVQNPTYPVPFPSGQVQFATPSIVLIAPGNRTPCLFQSDFSVERKFGKGRNYLTLDYTTVRGFRLYRMRNINAPLPTTGLRPNPNFININQFESSGSSEGNILTTTLKTSPHPRFDLMLQYTYAHTIDDSSGMFSLPADNYDLRGERGRADLDRRHRLNLMVTYQLPLRFRFGTVTVLNSGVPYNITTGVDNNHDTVANDRPPGVDRNTGRGPSFAGVDVHLSRSFHPEKNKHRPRIELGIDAFNVLNTVNYKDYIGTLTSPFFGRANAANPPREMQLSLQLVF
jgi:carboxypeptidase family protein